MQLRRLATQSMLPRLPQRRLMNNLPIATKSVTRKYHTVLLFKSIVHYYFVLVEMPYRMFSPPPQSAGEQAAVDQISLKATTMPGLDEHGEPRFLENVKLFLNRAA